MSTLNIFMSGVGGQGIGLLSDVLIRAAVSAGHVVCGCDTHGIAQRHGSVVSHLRLGTTVRTPRVPHGQADLVIGLERLETLRAVVWKLKAAGTVVYYDAVYQPIHVRMGLAEYPVHADLETAVRAREATLHRVLQDDLPSPQMQNVAVLGRLAALGAIPGVLREQIENALLSAIPVRSREQNLAVFAKGAQTPSG